MGRDDADAGVRRQISFVDRGAESGARRETGLGTEQPGKRLSWNQTIAAGRVIPDAPVSRDRTRPADPSKLRLLRGKPLGPPAGLGITLLAFLVTLREIPIFLTADVAAGRRYQTRKPPSNVEKVARSQMVIGAAMKSSA